MAVGTGNFAAIQAALVVLLQTVSGIGTVLEGCRYLPDQKAFAAQFISGSVVKGCTVQRTLAPEDQLVSEQNERKYTFRLRIMRSIESTGAGETAIDAVIDGIATVCRGQWNMSGTAEFSRPAQLVSKDERWFGEYLCHYAEMVVEVSERINVR